MTADRLRSNPCLTTWSIYDEGLSFRNWKMTATFVGELTTTLAAVTGHVTTTADRRKGWFRLAV